MKLTGGKIKLKRKSMNLTLNKLSSMIGCSASHLWEIEKNRVNPSASIINNLSKELHVPVDYLLNDDTDESSQDAVSKRLTIMIRNLDSESLSLVERIIVALQPKSNKP